MATAQAPIVTGQVVPAADSTALSAIAGRWEGRLGASGLRLALDITRTVDGLYFGTLTSIDQGGSRFPVDRVSMVGDSIRFEMQTVRVTYVAAPSADRTRLVGTWTQGGRARLEMMRVAAPPLPEPRLNAFSLFGVPAELSVAVRPTPFAAGGKQHLAYELRIANHGGVDMLLSRLEILRDSVLAARWEGLELHNIMAQRRSSVTDLRLIPAGGWAFAYVWVSIDSGARIPSVLRHRLTVGDRTLEGIVSVAAERAVRIGPPLRGADWVAMDGPSNASGHRRTVGPVGGRAYGAQRFAIDWSKVGADGQPFAGNRSDNAAYHAYGAEVIAVANAVVASVKDGIPDNVPGQPQLRSADQGDTLRAVPISLETVTGNQVVLDLGQGRYAFYGHLKPGSVRAKVGDRVRRGDVIGLVGNSGNSTGPHLHFHISDTPSPLAGEGLPYTIDGWEVMRGQNVWERRVNEIPMQNARVRFPPR